MHAVLALVLALLLWLTAIPAHAAIAFVAATSGQGTATSAMDSTGSTVLVACLTHVNASHTFADSKGNTWTRIVGPVIINDSTSLYLSIPTSVGTNHTFSLSSGGSSTDTILVAGFSGLAAASVERSASQIQSGLASGAAISSGTTATTIVADQVVIGCSQLSTNSAFTWTATGGATLAASLGSGNTASTGALSYKIVSTPGTQAATFTATAAGTAGTAVATLKASVVDTTAPLAPTGVNATATGSFSALVSFIPGFDAIGVCSNPVRRCSGSGCTPSTIVASPASSPFADTGLSADTLYRYTVSSTDCSSNAGPQSSIVETTTSAVTECNIAWTAPVGGTAPDSYNLRRCDTTAESCQPASVLTAVTAPTTTYKDTACPQPVACFDVQGLASGSGGAFTNFACVSTPAQTTPVLIVSPPSLTFATTVGGSNPANQTLTITNGTASTMNWTVGDDQAWINEAPSSGTNGALVTVSVSIAGLTAGTHLSNITVTAPGATGSPIVVPVTLNLSPAVTPTVGRGGRVR